MKPRFKPLTEKQYSKLSLELFNLQDFAFRYQIWRERPISIAPSALNKYRKAHIKVQIIAKLMGVTKKSNVPMSHIIKMLK